VLYALSHCACGAFTCTRLEAPSMPPSSATVYYEEIVLVMQSFLEGSLVRVNILHAVCGLWSIFCGRSP